jgi:Xaa-Pro aminopeptidase
MAVTLTVGLGLDAAAQRTGYTKEEFLRRRAVLMEKTGNGMIILFGGAAVPAGAHFRQDNDFYYYTGVDDTNAVVIMTPKNGRAVLFLPAQSPREEMIDGTNLLKDPRGTEKTGMAEIHPLSYLDEFIARNVGEHGTKFHVRLSPADDVDSGRWETGIFVGRKNRTHYNDQISLDQHRILKLKERYPVFFFEDVVPHIDAMRVIKSAEEIAILRRNGKISAEAVKQAMLASRPGGFEYEVEAAAMHVVLKHGARGFAYPPIVGSGPNSCVWHYSKNERRMESGDILLMDFGGDLDYMCMDISRTWPVSGKFSDEQREVYTIALEVLKACLEFYRPGVTTADVQAHVDAVMKKKGIDPRGQRGGIGHYVGMSTHDVGPRGLPLQEGMVFAIEPGLYYPEKNLGVRIEDTVLITKDGCEVLTKDVPKEIDEIEKLLATRK